MYLCVFLFFIFFFVVSFCNILCLLKENLEKIKINVKFLVLYIDKLYVLVVFVFFVEVGMV